MKAKSFAEFLDQCLILGCVFYGLYQLTKIADALVILASPVV